MLYLQSSCIMLAACTAQIPCQRKHQCRVAQRVIFHFLIPSTTHSWWPEDLELCAILHCLSLCIHPQAPFNPLHLFTLSPLTLPRYLFSSPFLFSLIVHPRAAKIQIPRSLYRAVSLCLSFFSAFSPLLSCCIDDLEALCHGIDDSDRSRFSEYRWFVSPLLIRSRSSRNRARDAEYL